MLVGCRVLLFVVIVFVVVCCRSLVLVVVCSCSVGSCWLFVGSSCLCFVVVCGWSSRSVRDCFFCIHDCCLLRVGIRVVVRVSLLSVLCVLFLVVCCLCVVVCCILLVCCLMYCAGDC